MERKSRIAAVIIWVLGTLACVRLFRFSLEFSQDFSVYWRAAHAWAAGENPYAIHGSDLGFVFKYPPWVLACFSWLAVLPEIWAKGLWAVLSLLASGFVVRWLMLRQGVSRGVAFTVLASFWWIWLGHFWAGQISLVMLAAALALFERKDALSSAVLDLVLSAKVFSLYPLAGRVKRAFSLKTLGWLALLLVALHLVLFAGGLALADYYSGWLQAASSGGTELGANVVRGQANHGLTALLLRGFGVEASNSKADIAVFFGLGILFGLAWSRVSRTGGLSSGETWAGWLALGVIIHPLAWHHSFVFVYPFAALATDRAWRAYRGSGDGVALVFAALGVALVGLLIPQVIGTEWVKPLELAGSKSWGVLLIASALLRARRPHEMREA